VSDLNEVIRYTRRLESILENSFGATGRGLSEKAKSVEDLIPLDVLKELKRIAYIRNKSVHEDGFEIRNIDRFTTRCQNAIDRLEEIAGQLNQEEEKRGEHPSEEHTASSTYYKTYDQHYTPTEETYLEEIITRNRSMSATVVLSAIALTSTYFIWNIYQDGRIPNLTKDVIPTLKSKFITEPKIPSETILPIPEATTKAIRWRAPERLRAKKMSEIGRYTVYLAPPAGQKLPRDLMPSSIDLVGEYWENGMRTGIALSIPKNSLPNALSDGSKMSFGFAIFPAKFRTPLYCGTSDISLISRIKGQDSWALPIKIKNTEKTELAQNFFSSTEFNESSHIRIVVFPMSYTKINGDHFEHNLPASISGAPNCKL